MSVSRILSITIGWTLKILCLPFYSCLRAWARRYLSFGRPHDPSPLPNKRINITQRATVQQPRNCHLLKLPPELRRVVYEQLLCGRTIYIRPDALHLGNTRRGFIRSTCYDMRYDTVAAQLAAGSLHIAILSTCRQVYLEAQPLLFQLNTFHMPVHKLPVIVHAGLGRFSLPHLRTLCLQDYIIIDPLYFGPPWDSAFPLLREMGLTGLVVDIKLPVAQVGVQLTDLFPQEDVLSSRWGRGILGIRNLHELDILVTQTDNPQYRIDVGEQVRGLMIGPGADERYRDFFEQSGKPARCQYFSKVVNA